MTEYKIFQIGFNKCGTWSIHDLFSRRASPKIHSVHWDGGLLAKSMMDNILQGKDILSKYPGHRVFIDMECCFLSERGYEWFFAFKHFEKLDRQYPGSKFILNTRGMEAWIESRFNHVCRHIIGTDGNVELTESCFYWQRMLPWVSKSMGRDVSKEELAEIWRQEREEHHNRVFEYFKDRPRDLLVFNLDSDPFSKFVEFFPDISFSVDEMPFLHRTKTNGSN